MSLSIGSEASPLSLHATQDPSAATSSSSSSSSPSSDPHALLDDVQYHWSLSFLGVQWCAMIFVTYNFIRRTTRNAYNPVPLSALVGCGAYDVSLTLSLVGLGDSQLGCEHKWIGVASLVLTYIGYGANFLHYLLKARLLNSQRTRRWLTATQKLHVLLIVSWLIMGLGVRLYFTEDLLAPDGRCSGKVPQWVVGGLMSIVIANNLVATLNFILPLRRIAAGDTGATLGSGWRGTGGEKKTCSPWRRWRRHPPQPPTQDQQGRPLSGTTTTGENGLTSATRMAVNPVNSQRSSSSASAPAVPRRVKHLSQGVRLSHCGRAWMSSLRASLAGGWRDPASTCEDSRHRHWHHGHHSRQQHQNNNKPFLVSSSSIAAGGTTTTTGTGTGGGAPPYPAPLTSTTAHRHRHRRLVFLVKRATIACIGSAFVTGLCFTFTSLLPVSPTMQHAILRLDVTVAFISAVFAMPLPGEEAGGVRWSQQLQLQQHQQQQQQLLQRCPSSPKEPAASVVTIGSPESAALTNSARP